MGKYIILLMYTWILWIQPTDSSTCSKPEACLYEDLFRDYNPRVRPRDSPSEVVEVKVGLALNSLASIDEKNEVMNIVALFHILWFDPAFTWNASDYSGMDTMIVSLSDIWRPNLAVTNSAGSFMQKTHWEDFYAVLSSNGLVYWAYGGTFSTTCPLDISTYPFDSQICEVQVYNWGYTHEYVSTIADYISTTEYVNNSLWELTDTSLGSTQTVAATSTYYGITFNFHWQRKTLYYNFNMVIPIVLLLVISLCGFWLPPDCGERVSLVITTLLSYAVFLIVIMDNTPINSEELPVISQFVMVVMIITGFVLLESVFIVALSQKDSRPPNWLKRLVFGCLARVMCLHKEVSDMTELEEQMSKQLTSKTEVMCHLKITDLETTEKIKHCQESMQRENLRILTALLNLQILRNQSEVYISEWKLVGKIIDRLMFIIVLVVTLIGVLVLLIN